MIYKLCEETSLLFSSLPDRHVCRAYVISTVEDKDNNDSFVDAHQQKHVISYVPMNTAKFTLAKDLQPVYEVIHMCGKKQKYELKNTFEIYQKANSHNVTMGMMHFCVLICSS